MKDDKRFIAKNEYDQFYEAVISNSFDGIVVIDRTGTIQFANPGAQKIFTGIVDRLVGYEFGIPAVDQDVEISLRQPEDDRLRVIKMRANPITWHGDKAYLAVLRDETVRIECEHEIREQQRWLDEAGHIAGIGGWTLDVKTKHIWWSRVTREIHEVPDDFEPDYDSAAGFYPGRAFVRLRSAVQNAIIQGKPYNLILPFVSAKGTELWVQTGCLPEKENGEVVRLRGTIQDVSEHMRVQSELEESERRFHNLFDYAANGLAIFEVVRNSSGRPIDFVTTDVNRAFEEIFRLRAEEIIGKSASDAIPEISESPTWQAVLDVAMTGDPQQLNYYSKTFNWFFDVTVFRPARDQVAIVIKEMTSEVLAQKALQENEKKYRQLFENALNGFALHEIILDKKGDPVDFRFLDVNEAFEEHTGIKPEDAIGKKATEVLPGIEDTELIALYGKVATTGEAQRFERYFEPLGRHYLILAFSPQERQFATVFLDITERKEIEQALQASERYYRELFAHAIFGFAQHQMVYDGNGEAQDFIYTEVNDAFGDHTGLDTTTLTGKTASEVLPMAKETGLIDIYGDVGLSGKPIQIDYYSPDLKRHFNISAFSLEPGKVVSSVSNISDRIFAENQLRKSEEKYRSLYESMSQGVIYQDAQGKIISANFAAEHILGLSLVEMQGKTSYGEKWKAIRMNGENLPRREHPAVVALTTGREVEDYTFGVYNPRRQDIVWISASSIPQFREGEDKAYRVFSTFTEITDLVRVRQALEQRVKELRCLAHVSGILQEDEELEVICPLVIDEIIAGMEFPDLTLVRLNLAGQVFYSEEPFEPTDFQLTSPIRGYDENLGMVTVFYKEDKDFLLPEEQELLDGIAERLGLWHQHQVTQALLVESEERFRKAIVHAPYPIMIHASDYEVMEVNDAWLTITGYSREEINTVDGWMRLAHPDRDQKFLEALSEDIAQERNTTDGQYAVQTKTGETLQWYFSSAPLGYLPDGRMIIITVAIDITDRVSAEQEKDQYYNRMIALREIDQAMISTLKLNEVLDVITNHLQNVIQFDSMSVLSIGEDSQKIIACQGFQNPQEIIGIEFPIKPGYPNYDVIVNREPIMTKNVSDKYPKFSQPGLESSDRINTWLGVPLVNQNEIIGMFTIDRNDENLFSQQDIDIAMQYASRAAIAITNARLFEQARLNIERLEILRQVDNAITSSRNLHDALDIILEKIQNSLGIDIVTVYKFDKANDRLVYLQNKGFKSEGDPSIDIPIGQGYVGTVAEAQEPLFVPEVTWEKSGYTFPFSFEEEGVLSYNAFPLIIKGELQGVLELKHRSRFEPDEDWIQFAETLARQTAIAVDNLTLFSDLENANKELLEAYDATIEGWAHALEIRDKETEGHSRRVVGLTVDVAKKCGIPEDELIHIRHGVLLHDIGKMGIPDQILHKPGPLDDAEWEIMRKHPVYAYDMLKSIDYLKPALNIPHYHHERWDGSGYPEGLKDEAIPLEARIFAVVDAWDALTSDRPYRKAWSEEKTKKYLKEMAGKEFDPEVVKVLLRMV